MGVLLRAPRTCTVGCELFGWVVEKAERHWPAEVPVASLNDSYTQSPTLLIPSCVCAHLSFNVCVLIT